MQKQKNVMHPFACQQHFWISSSSSFFFIFIQTLNPPSLITLTSVQYFIEDNHRSNHHTFLIHILPTTSALPIANSCFPLHNYNHWGQSTFFFIRSHCLPPLTDYPALFSHQPTTNRLHNWWALNYWDHLSDHISLDFATFPTAFSGLDFPKVLKLNFC